MASHSSLASRVASSLESMQKFSPVTVRVISAMFDSSLDLVALLDSNLTIVVLSIVKPDDEESAFEKRRDFSDDLGGNDGSGGQYYGEKFEFPASDVPTYDAIMKSATMMNGSNMSAMGMGAGAASMPAPDYSPRLAPLSIPAQAHVNLHPTSTASSPDSSVGSHSRSISASSASEHSIRSMDSRTYAPSAKKQWVIE